MSNQDNNTLIIDWSPPHEIQHPRFQCWSDKIEIRNELAESDQFAAPFNILLSYGSNVSENRKILKELLEKEEKDIIKFINFPKYMRYKIYKICGKNPLKFKKEVKDDANSIVNIIVSKYDYDDNEYEISVSDSDETRTFTTDVSSDHLEEENSDYEEESDSETTSSEETVLPEQFLIKLNNNNELILKEIKRTNRILITTGIVFTVLIGSIVFLDPVRLVVESKINCK